MNKIHIYKVKDKWYAQYKGIGAWRGKNTILLGLSRNSPKEAYDAFIKYWAEHYSIFERF